MQDLSRAHWRKSSKSASGGNCIEIAQNLPNMTAVRDSKDPDGHVFRLETSAWSAFVSAVKAGNLDR